MKKNWQFKVLLLFIAGWIILNIEEILIGLFQKIVTIPLDVHALLGNTFGFESWSNILSIINNPIILIFLGVLISTILIKSMHFIESLLED